MAILASNRYPRLCQVRPGEKSATVRLPDGAYPGRISGGSESDCDKDDSAFSSSTEGEREVRRGSTRGAPVADTVGTVSVCGRSVSVV